MCVTITATGSIAVPVLVTNGTNLATAPTASIAITSAVTAVNAAVRPFAVPVKTTVPCLTAAAAIRNMQVLVIVSTAI